MQAALFFDIDERRSLCASEDFNLYLVHQRTELTVRIHQVGDRFTGVQYRRMVASGYLRAYVLKRVILCQRLGKIHCNLPGKGYVAFSALGFERGHVYVHSLAYRMFYMVYSYLPFGSLYELGNQFDSKFESYLPVCQCRLSDKGIDHSFEFTDIGIDGFGHIAHYVVWDIYIVAKQFGFQYPQAVFVIRRIERCLKSPFETRKQTFLHITHIDRRFIGSEYQLPPVLMQMIKNMEKHFLGAGFAAEELYVVYYQQVDTLVKIYKIVFTVLTERIDILLYEFFGRNVKNFHSGIFFQHFISYGLCQMRLAESYPAVN